MRKLAIAILCIVFLSGCGESKPKEYTYHDLKVICRSIEADISEQMKNLTDIEIWGKSDDSNERAKHYREVYNKYMEEALKKCEIKQGTKVIVSGYVGRIKEVGSDTWTYDIGKISFWLKDSKDEKYGDFGCHTNDEKFLELEGNEAITIEGVFMKKGTGTGGMDYLSDCVLVNE